MQLTKPPKLIATTMFAFVILAFNVSLLQIVIPNKGGTPPMTGRQSTSIADEISPNPFKTQTTLFIPSVTLHNDNFLQVETRMPTVTPVPTVVTPLPTATPKPIVIPEGFLDLLNQVVDGQAGVVRGIFVEGVLSHSIIQQPAGDVAFVSTDPNLITEFQSANDNGVTGLLAHNYLTGQLFYNLVVGQEVWVAYGDGSFERYQIESVNRYQKLDPSSLRSELVDLATGEKVSTDQVFTRYYRGEHHLTLQTCLEEGGLSNWGLTFIVASPIY